jgi:hypothetical protein
MREVQEHQEKRKELSQEVLRLHKIEVGAMKKIIAVMVALSFFSGLASAAEPKAKEKKEELAIIKGPVVSLNIPQNQVVIKDSVTTYDRVFVVDPAVYKSIKLDDVVEARFVAGSNKIESIKVTKETKSTKKSKK